MSRREERPRNLPRPSKPIQPNGKKSCDVPAQGSIDPDQSRDLFMTYQNILVETQGRVGIIRLNRPQALNALNKALIAELTQAIETFDADEKIGCMLITGNDKAFAAGADIKEMADKPFIDAYLGDFVSNWNVAARARKPIVAAVAGFALGGGCELAMQCDIVIAADTAKFGQPEIKHAAARACGGQGQGHGFDLDRTDDGCS
jgi:enoyl-CoA hydratase